MAAAVGGVALGAIVAFLLLGDALGPEAWKGLAALTGTWTGGSANLIAVATSLGLSPEVQGIAILVDTIVGYSWMGILIALSARQASLDRRLRADRGEVEAIGARIEAQLERDRRPLLVRDAVLLVAIAIVTAATGLWLGRLLPPVGDVLTPFAWGILIVTTAALLLSLTPLARLDGAGASSLGYAGFYLLLASVGAQADLKKIVTQPLWIVAGVVVIAVHAVVLDRRPALDARAVVLSRRGEPGVDRGLRVRARGGRDLPGGTRAGRAAARGGRKRARYLPRARGRTLSSSGSPPELRP